MIRTLVVEDEINAFEYLASILNKIDEDIHVIGHMDSVKDTVNFLTKNSSPDLIFLDIQLADGLSFEIFNHLKVKSPIIFTTAYDQYAIDAFKLHSVDYLLKPVLEDDLRRSIKKLKEVFINSNQGRLPDLEELTKSLRKTTKNRCLVKRGGHYEYVEVVDISHIMSEDGITFIFTQNGQRFVYAKTVERLFLELDHNKFYQINRSQVVNIEAIGQIHPYYNQRLKVLLKSKHDSNTEFIVSRQRATDFKAWLDR